MVGRQHDLPMRERTQLPRSARRGSTRSQRLMFVIALLTVGLATSYTAVLSLTRVTPALFKGKNLELGVVSDVLENAGPVAVKKPDASSSFNRRQNLLIIGVDRRAGHPDNLPYNTDTIMVASLDPVTKSITLLSFPRDLWIDIYKSDGTVADQDRINASYARPLIDGQHSIKDGAEQLKRDLRANFGVSIDHWVWMDIRGVEKLIDAVGGITVDIDEEQSFFDWWYTDDDKTDPHYVSFPPGQSTLDGYNAVAFSRYREDSDIVRIKRQQTVLLAAAQAALSGGLFDSDPAKLWDAYNDVFRHDIEFPELVSYFPLLRGAASHVTTYSLGEPVGDVETVIPFKTGGGADVLDFDRTNVDYWVSIALTRTSYSGSSLEIRDGSGSYGQDRARQLGQYLQHARHLPGVSLGPDAVPTHTTTVTLYNDARRPMAKDIARWLGLPESAIVTGERPESASAPDIIIVVGQDQAIPTVS
jgi:polyisoprenyl-teichoic acid--peptidoglycan teichoic acid transferase